MLINDCHAYHEKIEKKSKREDFRSKLSLSNNTIQKVNPSYIYGSNNKGCNQNKIFSNISGTINGSCKSMNNSFGTIMDYRKQSSGISFGERYQNQMKYDEPDQIFASKKLFR